MRKIYSVLIVIFFSFISSIFFCMTATTLFLPRSIFQGGEGFSYGYVALMCTIAYSLVTSIILPLVCFSSKVSGKRIFSIGFFLGFLITSPFLAGKSLFAVFGYGLFGGIQGLFTRILEELSNETEKSEARKLMESISEERERDQLSE